MPEYELNLRDYWQVIRKRQIILWTVFFTVLVPTIIYTNMQKPLYRAVASVQWVERKAFANLLVELVEVPTSSGDPLITQASIVTSLPILEKVVKELGLVSEQATRDEIMQQAADIQGAVSTNAVSGTNMIQIIVTYGNPKMAADIANKIAEVYIAENLREKSKQNRTVREFIEKRLEEVNIKLKNSEEVVAKFQETEAPVGMVLAMQNKLTDLEGKRQVLLQDFTEMHPDVKNLESQISQIKEQMKTLPKKELEYARLTRDVEINAALYRQLKDKLEGARIAEAEKVGDASPVDSAVPPGAPISPNKQLNYFFGATLGLMLALTGIFMAEHLDTSIGTIEDVESYIGLPILGVIPFSPLEEEKRFTLPLFSKQKDRIGIARNRLIAHHFIQSSVIEAYRTLDTNIWSSFENKTSPKIMVVSSTAPGEGKTIISANLAITMAQRGMRVLLIDADLRRPLLYRLFNLKKDPGLTDILSGNRKLKDVCKGFTDLFLSLEQEKPLLRTPGLNNLQFITSGHLPNNPVGLFSSGRMSVLMDELRLGGDFNIVIIDSPPILPVSDVSIFGPSADAVIIVYQVGKTFRSGLQRTKKQMEAVGAKLKGIVLNCLNPQAEMSRPYYYYRYKYYGRRKEEEKDV